MGWFRSRKKVFVDADILVIGGGMVNVETVGGRIIEVHLRASDQWPDLYGRGWVEALIELYAQGEWKFVDCDRRDGFSVVLFGPSNRRSRHPPHDRIEEILAMPGVSSVQITFHEDRDPLLQAMPPGGFRLAIVNCWNLKAGLAARELLRACFPIAAQAKPRGGNRRTGIGERLQRKPISDPQTVAQLSSQIGSM